MNKALLVCAAIALCEALLSCSSKAKAVSMTAALDEADRYIAQGYPKDALKILSDCEKRILSPMEAIGVYKRYMALDKTKAAEKTLKNSLKKNPDNVELNAVYTYFLDKTGKSDEAYKRAASLRGTRYGSLYAEYFLRRQAQEDIQKRQDFYLSPEMQAIYIDAYNGSGDNAWLRNAALSSMKKGEYGDAAQMAPEQTKSSSDAYFWALVYYDNKKYGEAAECLLAAKSALDKKEDRFADGITESRSVNPIEVASLLSDCYVNMGEDKEAERIRSELIAQITLGGSEKSSAAEIGSTESLLGTMYLNSALYALQKNDERAAYNVLTFVTQKWPDNVSALIAYGNFAYNSSKRIMDDPLTKSLRDAGVVSTDMKRFDERPRVAVSDALVRMKESLARTHNDTLYVAVLELEEKVDDSSDDRTRLGRMYRVLERNATAADLYPEPIAQYAAHNLLRLDRYDEAKEMFLKYLAARYKLGKDRPFEEDLVLNLQKMSVWEVEYAAYFAAAEKNTDLTKRLYEYAVYETGYSSAYGGAEISPAAATESAVNLAMIYSSTGNKDKALELYGRAQSRATDNYLKSQIMYRLACIYDAKKDAAAAVKALEYSLYLDPANGNARLLLGKFKQ